MVVMVKGRREGGSEGEDEGEESGGRAEMVRASEGAGGRAVDRRGWPAQRYGHWSDGHQAGARRLGTSVLSRSDKVLARKRERGNR